MVLAFQAQINSGSESIPAPPSRSSSQEPLAEVCIFLCKLLANLKNPKKEKERRDKTDKGDVRRQREAAVGAAGSRVWIKGTALVALEVRHNFLFVL